MRLHGDQYTIWKSDRSFLFHQLITDTEAGAYGDIPVR